MQIVGVLQPTGTVLDYYHIMTATTFAELQTVGVVQSRMSGKELRQFYILNDQSMPPQFRDLVPLENLKGADIAGVHYVPMYYGATEAEMMKSAGKWEAVGDVVRNVFGNTVIVAKVFPLTNTVLDRVHFAGEELKLPQPAP